MNGQDFSPNSRIRRGVTRGKSESDISPRSTRRGPAFTSRAAEGAVTASEST